jgi:curli biogenesis system outer membrane secretion channel CsgG
MKILNLSALSVLSFSVFLNGCAVFAPNTEETKVNEPVAIRRKIKDVDYRTASQDKSMRKRLVVLPFLDKDSLKRPESARKSAREAFINDLNLSEKFIVMDSEQLTVNPENYVKESEYDLKRLAQDSQKSGISSIIEGQIIDVRLKKKADQIGLVRNLDAIYEVVVRLRIQSVRTGLEVFHTVKTVTLDEKNTRVAERAAEDQIFLKNPELVEILIKDAFLDFSPQIQEAMDDVTWEGRIAAIRGDKIYLNVGRISGVQVGDLLKVVEDSTEVFDPEVGYNLGKVQGRSKGTLEIISYFGNDGAVGVVHSGAGFKESDRVEVFQ